MESTLTTFKIPNQIKHDFHTICRLKQSSMTGEIVRLVTNYISQENTNMKQYQICHIAELIRNQIDSSMKLEFGARPYSSNQIMHMQANISKLYQQTGWQPKVSLEDGIAQTVEWFRKN